MTTMPDELNEGLDAIARLRAQPPIISAKAMTPARLAIARSAQADMLARLLARGATTVQIENAQAIQGVALRLWIASL